MTSADNPTSCLSSIHHDGSNRYVLSSNGTDLHMGDEVIVRLRAAANAPIERILLSTCPVMNNFLPRWHRRITTLNRLQMVVCEAAPHISRTDRWRLPGFACRRKYPRLSIARIIHWKNQHRHKWKSAPACLVRRRANLANSFLMLVFLSRLLVIMNCMLSRQVVWKSDL